MIRIRTILCLIFTLFASIGLAQDIGPGYEGMEDGDHTDKYWGGKTSLSWTIKNGEVDGDYIEYFRNGKIKSEARFEDGKLNGPIFSYSKKGQIEVSGFYRFDTLITYKQVEYYRRGGMKWDRTIEFATESLVGDPFKDPETTVMGGKNIYDANKRFQNLESTGVDRRFHKNGEVMRVEPLVNDMSHGQCYTYCDNGEIYEVYHCVEGLIEGECKVYNCEGTMIKIEKWDKGKKISERIL